MVTPTILKFFFRQTFLRNNLHPSGDGNMHILVMSFFDYYVSIYTPKGTEALVEWLVRVSMITVYPPPGTETIINTLFCFI